MTDINLASLTPSQGFPIYGESTGNKLGYSVKSAGDINKDGYGDIIMGAPYADSNRGTSYIIFGSTQGFVNIDLKSLTSSQGFAITGCTSGDDSGYSVSGVGDINGDGIDDVAIGAPGSYGGKGSVYVIFGKTNSLSDIDLCDMDNEPSLGGIIVGCSISDQSGYSVDGIRDFNGDNIGDIIIGAPGAYSGNGASYIIFGKVGFSTTEICDITSRPQEGMAIIGGQKYGSGYSVSDAGDVDGDKINDMIIGTHSTDIGMSYIIYGNSNPSTINLGSLTSTQGISITGATSGDQCGSSVAGAGDINKDGYGDVIIGAWAADSYAGISYIIYGSSSLTNINLGTLTPTNGVFITGANPNDHSGGHVNYAGDINSDGYSDVIIGADTAASTAGICYVIYGGSDLLNIDLADFDSNQGFSIIGASTGDATGLAVAYAGDINGNKIDDIIIGAPYATSYTGKSYVIYGSNSPTIIPTLHPTVSPSISFAPTALRASDSDSSIKLGTIATVGVILASIVGAVFTGYIIVKICSENEIHILSGNHVLSGNYIETTSPVMAKPLLKFFSEEMKTLPPYIQNLYLIKKQELLSTKSLANKNFDALDIFTEHTYTQYPSNGIYNELLSNFCLLHLLTYSSKLLVSNYNKAIIIFADDIPSNYREHDHLITVNSNTNTTYINNKTIFMHELIHMIFDNIAKNISNDILINACEITKYSLISHAAELMEAENSTDINSLITNLKYNTELDLFYLKSTIQNTVEHQYDAKLINHIAKLLDTYVKNEKELIATFIPQIVEKYNLNAEQVYFLERIADYINGINNHVYAEDDHCEELAARCIEFRAADVSNEILDLCKPIEDLLMQGINNTNIDNEFV